MKSNFSGSLFAVWISKIFHVLSFYCIWKWWCHFMIPVAIGSQSLISFYCVCFVSIYFFFFFLVFFVSSITCWGIELSLEMLKIRWWNCSYVPSGVLRGELLQLYLVINVTGLVEPTEPGLVWKILVTSYLQLPVRITCCRVSRWK